MKELTFNENELIVSKTDTKGKITYGNELFLKLAGYKESEILGAPHNIVRHPDMPKIVFKLLWDEIKAGREVNAYVVNSSKNGNFYWVFANVTPSMNAAGHLVGYYSVRRKPKQSSLDIIKPFYKELLAAEKSGGMSSSGKMLDELVSKNGGSYEKFILSI